MNVLVEACLVGIVLAASEALATVLTGRNLDATFLVEIAVFDLLSGVVAAALAGLVRRHRLVGGDDYASRFVPLAVASAGMYAADKVLLAASSRDQPVTLALALLLVLSAALLILGIALCRRFARTEHP